MHSFLRAIGFNEMNKKEIDHLIQGIIKNPDRMEISKDSQGNEFVVLSKEFENNIGINVCGEFIEEDNFQMEYYYPYFIGAGLTTEESVEIEKHADKESYAGICDEMRIGVTLIFYLQNIATYLNEKSHDRTISGTSTTLSGLSLKGKILLPISKNEIQIKNTKMNFQERTHLLAAARDGDEDAIENLTLEDIDTYSMLSKRIEKEDILSIVDSYFMPYGIESDQYSILGVILDCNTVKNRRTQEEVCIMTIESNNLIYDICINYKDLLGEPEVGRRFKGNIWLQGHVNY